MYLSQASCRANQKRLVNITLTHEMRGIEVVNRAIPLATSGSRDPVLLRNPTGIERCHGFLRSRLRARFPCPAKRTDTMAAPAPVRLLEPGMFLYHRNRMVQSGAVPKPR